MNDDRQANEAGAHRLFPLPDAETDPGLAPLLDRSRALRFPGGQRLSGPGADCTDYLLVLEGGLRVQVMTASGREVKLYDVLPGEGCVLTTSCLLGRARFPAEALTLADTRLLALPASAFHQALGVSSLFRSFVFGNFGQRLAGVIARLERLCSPSIDRTLAETLLGYPLADDGALHLTHAQLALELGTAREVVSRHLKRLEAQGGIRLGRGIIHILKPDLLAALAGG